MLCLNATENKMEDILKRLKMEGAPVVLYGAGNCGLEYKKILDENKINVLCFTDDDIRKQGTEMGGVPVWSLDKLKYIKNEYNILISSYGPSKLYPNLQRNGLADKVIPSEFYLWESGLDYRVYYGEYLHELNEVYSILADEKSKKVFCNLLNYKITRNISLIEEIDETKYGKQYFDKDIIKYNDDEVFVDLGAYIGDTIIDFEKQMEKNKKKIKKIFAFEPDQTTFAKLKENTRQYENIDYINMGAYSKDDILKFMAEGFWTSAISEKGDILVPVCALDHKIDIPVTFLKADIEGAEKEAICGAENIICHYKPKIAFCIYHKKEDIFEIPLMLKKLNPEYKFYMRQYSEIPVESIVYAI